MRVVTKTDVGSKRINNEDKLLSDEEGKIFIICDGMGGHDKGEIASGAVATTLWANVALDNLTIEDDDDYIKNVIDGDIIECQTALNKACGVKSNGGTTLSSLFLLGDFAWTVHVGDSRIYDITNKKMITKDHTVAQEMADAGKITQAEIKNSWYSHQLSNVFQANTEIPKVDILKLPIKVGDRFLLCSDGLSNEIEDEELYEICNGDWDKISEKLSELCFERGARDNFSFIVIEI